jgi:CubicO group peptidase (beta-lactamase class C family)
VPERPAPAPSRETPPAASAPVAAPFAAPENIGPKRFLILGPFAVPDKQRVHQSLDHDYLSEIGGESAARLQAGARIELAGETFDVKPLETTSAVLDFVSHFQPREQPKVDTNQKVAYAYAEFEVAKPTPGIALFGSDDGAAVWLNGKRVHHVAADRAVDPESDRFEVSLVAGKNRILVKVDNGGGGWGFSLRIYDDEGKQRIAAREARRELDALDPGPANGRYLLKEAFPEISFRNQAAAKQAFGDAPLETRWFGPNLAPAQAPSQDGRYVAVLEARTRDGFTYRRMLTFAKVPPDTVPWIPVPPMYESPQPIPFPAGITATPAERAELSRHIWAGGVESLWHGRNAPIAAVALHELGPGAPSTVGPAWLQNGFIKNAEHQLALRIKFEGRTPRPLGAPQRLEPKAGELREGSELRAGMKPGTTAKLRALGRRWAKADPNGFVVLVARRGIVFMHEGFNGFSPDSRFLPASIAKSIAGLTFARAVDQGLAKFDQPVASVLSEWNTEKTKDITFRNCFNHVTGLTGHASHGGLFNAYLDNALLIQDAVFTEPGTVFHYNGDGFNLAGRALELMTGQSIFRLLHEQSQQPYGEVVTQFDLGFGDGFTALYLAKVGQMFLQDGAYGSYRLFTPGFVKSLYPRPIGDSAPRLINKEIETGIGLTWMIDPPGDRQQGVLGPNVLGHGSGSGTMWRVALDHDLVIVVGRNQFRDGSENDQWATKLATAVAESLAK